MTEAVTRALREWLERARRGCDQPAGPRRGFYGPGAPAARHATRHRAEWDAACDAPLLTEGHR
ncbi:hypothetical protein [Benzoatithermus flavus]|uniref:hypothetical protein n=1 Tax=Benzoatithermus flavus TaxID=3108223 RepID=UPI003AADB4CA